MYELDDLNMDEAVFKTIFRRRRKNYNFGKNR